jgi:hypothetical protein
MSLQIQKNKFNVQNLHNFNIELTNLDITIEYTRPPNFYKQ